MRFTSILSVLSVLLSVICQAQVSYFPPRGNTVPNGTPGGVPYYISATTLGSTSAGTPGQCLQSNGAAAPTWGACGIGSAITSLNGQTGSVQVFANDTNNIITSSNNTHTLGWAGTLSLARGGSGASLTAISGGSVYSTGSALAILAAGTSGQVLTSGGASAPTWSTPTVGTVTNVTGSGNIASSGGSTPNITFTGVLPIANGGTNNGSLGPVIGGIVYTDATKEAVLAAGTSGQILTSNGGAAPSWQNQTVGATRALDNLASVAINTSLIFGSAVGGVLETLPTSGGVSSTFMQVTSGSATNNGNSGLAVFQSGGVGDGTSGIVFVQSGDVSGGTSGSSGNVTVTSGAAATSGNSGSVTLATGTVSGGTRGKIKFTDGSEGTSGQVWTSTDTAGSGHWAATAATGITSLNAQTNATQVFANDTNVIITSSAGTHTLGWAGTLSLARGGSGAALTAVAGGSVYSTGSALAILAAGTSGQVLTSGGASAPTWSTPTVGTVTNVTGSGNIASSGGSTPNITFTGVLPIANGGTNNGSLAPVVGGVIYSDATKLNTLAAGTSGQLLSSGGGAAPSWLSVVPIAQGGTNNGSLGPVVGGIVYTDASKEVVLAAGTSGQVLKSNGGAAPSWGTDTSGITSLNAQTGATQVFANDTNIIITSSSNTHTLGFTGTLSVARGGTGSGSFTAGSVPYSNGSILTEDNANFFWDGTNHRLGIGTSAPASKLDIQGASANVAVNIQSGAVGNFAAVAVGRASNTEGLWGVAAAANQFAQGAAAGDGVLRTSAGKLFFDTNNGSGTPSMTILGANGNVGIGTNSPGALLDIAGQFRTSGTTATIGTCGSSPSITGTNQSGKFTTGSGVLTACTISFSTTLANAPNACIISPANASAAAVATTGAYVSSVSTSSFVVTGSNLTSDAYYYHCY